MLPQGKYVASIYPLLLEKFHLSISDGVLLSMILDMTIKYGFCGASKTYLARHLNTSTDSIFKQLRKLRKGDLIDKVHPSESGWQEYFKKTGSAGGDKRASCYMISRDWFDAVRSFEEGTK